MFHHNLMILLNDVMNFELIKTFQNDILKRFQVPTHTIYRETTVPRYLQTRQELIDRPYSAQACYDRQYATTYQVL